MKKVGLTGGIGSGKTFVAEVFKRIGLPVFHADLEAKNCLVEDLNLINEVKKNFGSDIYENGLLKKKKLADIIFNDIDSLHQLNSLVHPVVKKRFEDWCISQKSDLVIKEAAIIFESSSNLSLDDIICVSANEDLRIKRVIERDRCSYADVISRIKVQMSQSAKEKLSDFVIYNNEDKLLLPQILDVIKQIS